MADLGPCGPCSEIHVDLRSAEERKKVPEETSSITIIREGDRDLESLMFMEFERYWNPQKGGANKLLQIDLEYRGGDKKAPAKNSGQPYASRSLPNKNVDAYGLWRLCRAINGKIF